MKITIWLFGILLAAAAGAAVFIRSGAYNVAADDPHWPATSRILETVRNRSIAARAADIAVPELDDPELIRSGAGNYDAMCAGCHLRPGLEGSELSVGLYPPPPNLATRRDADAARDFVAIKHGIKMTGMPAWGASMEDRYIWGMVAFLQKLAELTPAEYQAQVDASGGHSHGGGEAGAEGHHDEARHGHADSQADHPDLPHEHDEEPMAEAAPHTHADGEQHEH